MSFLVILSTLTTVIFLTSLSQAYVKTNQYQLSPVPKKDTKDRGVC